MLIFYYIYKNDNYIMWIRNTPRNDIIKDLKISLDNIDANEAKKIIDYIREKRNKKIFITKENLGSLRLAIDNSAENKSYITNSDLKALKNEFLNDIKISESNNLDQDNILKWYTIWKGDSLSSINMSLPINMHINFNSSANNIFPLDKVYINNKWDAKIKRNKEYITIWKISVQNQEKDQNINLTINSEKTKTKTKTKEVEVKELNFIKIQKWDYLWKIIKLNKDNYSWLKLTNEWRKTRIIHIWDKINIDKEKWTFTMNNKIIARFDK